MTILEGLLAAVSALCGVIGLLYRNEREAVKQMRIDFEKQVSLMRLDFENQKKDINLRFDECEKDRRALWTEFRQMKQEQKDKL